MQFQICFIFHKRKVNYHQKTRLARSVANHWLTLFVTMRSVAGPATVRQTIKLYTFMDNQIYYANCNNHLIKIIYTAKLLFHQPQLGTVTTP